MLRMFKEHKETIAWTANKIPEYIRVEMIKIHIEMTKLKNLVGEMKNLLDGFISRDRSSEYKMSYISPPDNSRR